MDNKGSDGSNKEGKDSEDEGRKDDNDDDDDESIHFGESLIASDQSAITGESLAVDKYIGDVVYYTTGCKRGKAYAIITTSARYSFVGKTANLVQGTKDRGHFKAVMDSIWDDSARACHVLHSRGMEWRFLSSHPNRVAWGPDVLIHSGLTGTVQHDLVERADSFAKVFPEHKYQVVEMLQQRGSLTAMTGDGSFVLHFAINTPTGDTC